MWVNISADTKQLVPMQEQIREIFIIVRQKASIREYQLEAIVKFVLLIESEDKPTQCLVLSWLSVHLLIDIGNSAIMAEVFRNELPVVSDRLWSFFWICLEIITDVVFGHNLRPTLFLLDESVFKEVVDYYDEISEELVLWLSIGSATLLVNRILWCIPCIAE